MLYYLFRFLDQFGIPGSHMWGYISFRALLALILSLAISAWFGEKFIKYLKSKQITEVQRDAKIDPFGVKKIGVPSMGGIIIIAAHARALLGLQAQQIRVQNIGDHLLPQGAFRAAAADLGRIDLNSQASCHFHAVPDGKGHTLQYGL